MEVGIVKWFNNAKGFGFITSDSYEGDIFAHFSVIEGEGYRSLKMGQKVHFEFIHGDKGASAVRIVPITE
ncbi:cold shock domain-containing protein CspD [Glaesserella parasuis]|uniref:Cold shock-like protein CspD n=1 Tax=Glaesserella parasuis TaxID=738 RepID=A0AAX1M7L1_GLAPU|nr:cold shock domain-containing protein CspD [Glaesserella parasuis]MDG6301123.1 cold shock domain-containing protein CspD [Glaesserella parasuis]MDG6376194.1 cold shock domain-containing protein CspD [Glaesserella parasuis]MDG6428237.1 cold shock domain-containing protein CspD [Glaesserella parasuis]MDG6431012.1 cold shock domain-containing protein CspD [Glaesserella parasuis]MDG6448243.1 cold shock domain-containing protein CspD [Glaesserella parasuis]